MKKILILGSSGFLGKSISDFLDKKKYTIFNHTNSKKSKLKYDLTKFQNIKKLLSITNPNFIINCTGLTDVDYCEKNYFKSYEINSLINLNLSNLIYNRKDIHLLHISTDQVYNNFKKNYSLEDNINLSNIYSITKFLGEKNLDRLTNKTILRTNFFDYGKKYKNNSFCNWLIGSVQRGKIVKLVDDVYFNPISIKSLNKYIDVILHQPLNGTFNLGSKNGISKYKFGIKLIEKMKLDKSFVIKASIDELNLFAYRPKNMLMDCKKFQSSYNVTLPNISNEINQINEH